MNTIAGGHPRHQLSEILHNPVRFSVVAALDKAEKISFQEVKEAIEVTDSALSKQVASLQEAGYVLVQKSFVGKYPRTMLSLTKDGRKAWQAHLSALREIAGIVS
jgi:DNA-binding MarR family transcriptional regulator